MKDPKKTKEEFLETSEPVIDRSQTYVILKELNKKTNEPVVIYADSVERSPLSENHILIKHYNVNGFPCETTLNMSEIVKIYKGEKREASQA